MEGITKREAIIRAGMEAACELAVEGNYADATKFMEIVTDRTDGTAVTVVEGYRTDPPYLAAPAGLVPGGAVVEVRLPVLG